MVVEELRKNCGPLIGSLSHQARSYGPRLIQLGVTLLRGHTVPPSNYVQHRLITQGKAPADW